MSLKVPDINITRPPKAVQMPKADVPEDGTHSAKMPQPSFGDPGCDPGIIIKPEPDEVILPKSGKLY